ncbi:MAG: hypothetical protein WDA47_03775 [Bacilli bacterium]
MKRKVLEQALTAAKKDSKSINRGELKILQAYHNFKRRTWEGGYQTGTEELVITGTIEGKETVSEMAKFFKKAEIETFIFADSSTALMRTLHTFMTAGFEITEPVLIKREGFLGDALEKGLRIRIK